MIIRDSCFGWKGSGVHSATHSLASHSSSGSDLDVHSSHGRVASCRNVVVLVRYSSTVYPGHPLSTSADC